MNGEQLYNACQSQASSSGTFQTRAGRCRRISGRQEIDFFELTVPVRGWYIPALGGGSSLNLEVRCGIFYDMKTDAANKLKDGARCKVIAGTHKGKSGVVRDIKTGKTGHVSITVVQSDGVKLKTLAKNVAMV